MNDSMDYMFPYAIKYIMARTTLLQYKIVYETLKHPDCIDCI